jgi:hypothetical protein
MLIHATSVKLRPTMKVNIHNQCLNVDLVSSIYTIGNGLECYKSPDYRVYAGNIMRSGFIINKSDDASYGVLICKL